MDNTSHIPYTERLENMNKNNISGIQWIGLKYKETLDNLWNTINIISNSFFNFKEDGTEKSEQELKEMKNLQFWDITARMNVTQRAKDETIQIQKDILNDEKIIPIIKTLLLKKIEQILQHIQIIQLATPIEAQKYTYILDTKTGTLTKDIQKQKNIWLYKKHYNKNINNITAIQDNLYGPKISDTIEERDLIISKLNDLLTKNKSNITSKEITKFSRFLERFPITTKIINTSKTDKKSMKWNIPLTSIKNISNYVINNFYNIPEWKTDTKIGKNNLSVNTNKKELNLPANKTTFSEDSLSTIVEHEIGWHVVRWSKWKTNLWFSWNNYENIEEWITKLNEYFIHYDSLENIALQPEMGHIAVFIWENYDFENTLVLLKIYFKLTWKSYIDAQKLAINRTKRVKSYYHRDQPWANRKDVIYYRGVKKLIEYLKILSPQERTEFFNDAYFAKLSFEDISLVTELKKQLNITQNKTDIPFPLWKLIFRKQNFKNQTTNNSKWAFLWAENIQKNLIADDFRFLKLSPLTHKKKKQVINIMQYKEESKEYENLKKDIDLINNLIKSPWYIIDEIPFNSSISKKLFEKIKNMKFKEIENNKTLKRKDKTRGNFSLLPSLQKLWDQIESILGKKLN